MSDYLFLFSITPVQAFIEQARKTQDLYAGSKILSHLCRTAIEASTLTPEQIIFPNYDPTSIDSGYCLPNRFLARFEANEETLNARGAEVERAVKHTFYEMAKIVIEKHTGRETLTSEEERQIDTYLTINWVFVPVNGDYNTAYTQIERDLGAIKQVRMFAQLEQEPGRKCAICGERNVKFYRKTEKESEDDQPLIPKKLFINNEHDMRLWKDRECSPTLLKRGEGLCAVCFTKRGIEAYFRREDVHYIANFPSTPTIALWDTIMQLPADRQRKWLDETFDAFTIFNKKNHNEDQQADSDPHEYKKACELYEEIKDLEISSYYAVLRFDGDNMGKWLSGEKLAKQNDLFAFHKALSERLRAFAEHTTLSSSEGKIVYIGGDDFLGFVTLKNLFTVLRRLREEFQKQVSQKLFQKSSDKEEPLFELADKDEELTFSASVVIAHYHTPLAEVLKWSRNMEKAAKASNPKKDAFALAVLKRSGEIQQATFKWKKHEQWIPDVLEKIIRQIREQKFSGTFLNALELEFRKVIHPDGTYSEPAHIRTEITRLVKRSKENATGQPDLDEMTQLVSMLFALDWERDSLVENFFSAVGIIDFLTRKVTS